MLKLLTTAACVLTLGVPALAQAPRPPNVDKERQAEDGLRGDRSPQREQRGQRREERRGQQDAERAAPPAEPPGDARRALTAPRSQASPPAATAAPRAAERKAPAAKAKEPPAQAEKAEPSTDRPKAATAPPAAEPRAASPRPDAAKAAEKTAAPPPAATPPTAAPSGTAAPTPPNAAAPAQPAARTAAPASPPSTTAAPNAATTPPAAAGTTSAPTPGTAAPPAAQAQPPQAQPPGEAQRRPDRTPEQRADRRRDRRDGLSAGEALGLAGLAMAPWLIDRMVQNREPPPIGYAPRYLPPTYYGAYGYGYAPVYGETGEVIIEERYEGAGTPPRERRTSAGGGQARTVAPPPVVQLSDWQYDEIYGSSWGAAQMMRGHVVNARGEDLGRLRNVIIGPDDRAVSVLIDIRGQGDGAETIVNVPWNEVRLQGRDVVEVSVSGQDLARFSLFGRNNVLAGALAGISKDSSPAQRTWKASDLIDDYVTIADGSGYGYVDDVVFDQSGRIQAVVVKRDVTLGGGTYALPFYGAPHGFDPWLPYYAVPYDDSEMAALEPFDEGRMD